MQHWTELLSSEQPTLVEGEYCCKNTALYSRLKVLLKSTAIFILLSISLSLVCSYCLLILILVYMCMEFSVVGACGKCVFPNSACLNQCILCSGIKKKGY